MILQSCFSQSTAHGLGNIGNEPTASGRIIWSLLTIATVSFFIYHTYLLYGQFLEEKVLVSTHQFAIDFLQPDIVVCSDRIFARDYINNPPDADYGFMHNVSQNIQNFDKLYRQSGRNLTTFIWDSLNLHQLFKAFYHRKHQLFLRITCNLVDIDLDMSSLEVEINFLYMACYRLKSSVCKMTSPFNNLVIKFYTYIYGVTITYSKLKVLIYNRTIDTYLFDQRDPIDEMEDGIHLFFVQPMEGISLRTPKVTAPVNQHTYIKIQSTEFSRVSTKLSPCLETPTYLQIYNLLEENVLSNPVSFAEYSLCVQAHFQEKMYATLGCVSSKYPIVKSIPSNFTFCGNLFFNKRFIDYMSLWNNSDIIDPIVKRCKVKRSCKTIYHRPFVNYNNWPRMSTLRNLFKFDIPRRLQLTKNRNLSSPGLLEALHDYKTNPANIKSWQRNFIKVSISPGEYRSTTVEESLSYSLKNFFSDVGGIMGFYMGASLLTVCEIFRLLQYIANSVISSKKMEQDVEAQMLNEDTQL